MPTRPTERVGLSFDDHEPRKPAAMTVQTISVPLTVIRLASGDETPGDDSDVGALSHGACPDHGRCDRSACRQAERVTRHCPELETPPAQA